VCGGGGQWVGGLQHLMLIFSEVLDFKAEIAALEVCL
jgi:hypothetical protein